MLHARCHIKSLRPKPGPDLRLLIVRLSMIAPRKSAAFYKGLLVKKGGASSASDLGLLMVDDKEDEFLARAIEQHGFGSRSTSSVFNRLFVLASLAVSCFRCQTTDHSELYEVQIQAPTPVQGVQGMKFKNMVKRRSLKTTQK